MITLTERNNIAKIVLTTQDETVIRKIESIVFPSKQNGAKRKLKIEKDSLLNWDELPDEIKTSVERGLVQSKAGKTIPHDEVMKKYKKWLKK